MLIENFEQRNRARYDIPAHESGETLSAEKNVNYWILETRTRSMTTRKANESSIQLGTVCLPARCIGD